MVNDRNLDEPDKSIFIYVCGYFIKKYRKKHICYILYKNQLNHFSVLSLAKTYFTNDLFFFFWKINCAS